MSDVKTEADWLESELRQLATVLHKRAYPHVTQWRLSDTPRGVLSQIDNMTAGLLERIEKLEAAVSWVSPMFVDEKTTHDELKARVQWLVRDARAADPSAHTPA